MFVSPQLSSLVVHFVAVYDVYDVCCCCYLASPPPESPSIPSNPLNLTPARFTSPFLQQPINLCCTLPFNLTISNHDHDDDDHGEYLMIAHHKLHALLFTFDEDDKVAK